MPPKLIGHTLEGGGPDDVRPKMDQFMDFVRELESLFGKNENTDKLKKFIKEKLRGRKVRVTRKIEAPRGGPWNKTRTDTVIVYDHTLEEVLNEFVQENDMTIPGDDYGDWYSDENDDRKKKIWKEKKSIQCCLEEARNAK